jgi:outer membrane protein TolC
LQQLETTRAGLDAATLSYETQDGKYLAGAANFIDLVNAQNTLLLARQNRAQALINLSLQKKVIDLYLGK